MMVRIPSVPGRTMMTRNFAALLSDERGAILSAELVLVATIGGLGLLAGLTSVRDSLTEEMSDLAGSIRSLDQSYAYGGMRAEHPSGTVKSWTAGSRFGEGPEIEERVFLSRPSSPTSPVPPAPMIDVPAPPAAVPPTSCPLPKEMLLPPSAPTVEWPSSTFHQMPGTQNHPMPTMIMEGPLLMPQWGAPLPPDMPPRCSSYGSRLWSKMPPLPEGTSFPFVW